MTVSFQRLIHFCTLPFLLLVFTVSECEAQQTYSRFTNEQLRIFMPSQTRIVRSLAGIWEKSENDGSSWEQVTLPMSETKAGKVRFRRSIKFDKKQLYMYNWSLHSLGTNEDIELYLNGKLLIDRTLNRNKSSDVAKIEIEQGKKYALKIEYTQQWYNAEVKLTGAPQNPNKFKEAIEAAKKADVAVVVLGTDETVEKEGVDRPDLNLPGDQEDLVKAVFKANPKTIVVLQNGSTISVTWLKENVPAIFETWYNGEEGGNALADVIFGDYNPAGRLPLTFYKTAENFPSFSDYDIRKGRTYMYRKNSKENSKISEVLYPFGF